MFGAEEGMFLGFLSKSVEKSLPLFKTLKKCIMKRDFQWIAKAEHLFKQLKQRIAELPILTAPRPKEELIIRALQGPELNYTPIEKLVLALVNAARRLRSVLLGEHDIIYRPRTSIRGQILADFIMEKPEENNPEESDTVLEELPKPWTL
ncbi:hypothetical protein Tco_0203911, partial [Tanacetum coccineum]